MTASGQGGRPSRKRALRDVIRQAYSSVAMEIGVTMDESRHFTPAWFAIAMGTGSISILFHNFPYSSDSQVMRTFSLAFFFLSLALLVLFTVLSVAKCILVQGTWNRTLRDPTQALYLGTFPMSATTLLTASVDVINDIYKLGRPFVYTIWALWWLDAAISILCSWGIIHIMITRQEHTLESMTLTWLLPVATLVVEAATGGTIAHALIPYSPNDALITVTFSACMVIFGVALTVMFLTVYLIRTIFHGYLKGSAILSVFLPLGPSGQGAYSILMIGSGFKLIMPLIRGETDGITSTSSTGETVNTMCFVTAFALWCFGGIWMILAILGLWHSLRRARVPFKLTFWSMVFPNGVYANCTLALAATFSSAFFRILGAIYAVATLLLWIYVAVETVRTCPGGQILDPEEDMGVREDHI